METIIFGEKLSIKLYTNTFIDPDEKNISRGRAKWKNLDFGGETEKDAYFNLIGYIALQGDNILFAKQ